MSKQRAPHALSELSVTEFLTLSRVGFCPHGLVIGSSIFEAGTQYDWVGQTREMTRAQRRHAPGARTWR